MPELPEVEIVRRGLEKAALHKNISRVILNRGDLRFPIPAHFQKNLEGHEIVSLRRRGKYILCFVESGEGFILHLGMSGRIKIIPAGEKYEPQKHDHVVFILSDSTQVIFNDPRRFGFVDLTHNDTWRLHDSFKAMGPEPLSNDFHAGVLAAALKGRKSPIKTALLDQKIVAGLGNIYVCEALFMAGINPHKAAGDVKAEKLEILTRCIRDVLSRAIDAGGSSLRDYHHTDGSLGYFQHQFCVYDQAGNMCPGCDCDLSVSGGIKRVAQAGRSTFYCPVRQE